MKLKCELVKSIFGKCVPFYFKRINYVISKSKNKVDVIFVKQTSEKWNAPSESEKKCETKISTCEI